MRSGGDCIFCHRPFTRGNPEAKEHVLRRELIRRLDHVRTPLILVPRNSSMKQVARQREHPVIALEVKGVCRGCNGGWINDLDIAVEGLIISLSKNQRQLEYLSDDEKSLLSRWSLKTACTFMQAEDPRRMSIPRSHHDVVRKGLGLPGDMLFFGAQLPRERGIAAIYDQFTDFNIPADGSVSLFSIQKKHRYRFMAQYDGLFLGVAYMPGRGHYTVNSSESFTVFAEGNMPVLRNTAVGQMPIEYAPTAANALISNISFTFI